MIKLLLAFLLIFAVFTQQTAGAASGNDFDVDESQANNLISSLFAGNPNAARAIQASSSPAPSSAPAGAALSASAPTAAQRAQSAAPTTNSFLGGAASRFYYPINWGRWVRVLRCSYQQFGSGFCCRWVWIWRSW